MMAFLTEYRPIFMTVTFALLGSAFYLSYRPRRSKTAGGSDGADAGRQSKMMKFNRVMLWTVTVVAVVFLFFPQTVTNLFATDEIVTADMQQTVITIEGMT